MTQNRFKLVKLTQKWLQIDESSPKSASISQIYSEMTQKWLKIDLNWSNWLRNDFKSMNQVPNPLQLVKFTQKWRKNDSKSMNQIPNRLKYVRNEWKMTPNRCFKSLFNLDWSNLIRNDSKMTQTDSKSKKSSSKSIEISHI